MPLMSQISTNTGVQYVPLIDNNETNYDNRWSSYFDIKITDWWKNKQNEHFDEFQRKMYPSIHLLTNSLFNLYTDSHHFQQKVASSIDRQFNYTKINNFFTTYSKSAMFETILDNSFYRFLTRDKAIMRKIEQHRKYVISITDDAMQNVNSRIIEYKKQISKVVDDIMKNEMCKVRESTVNEIDKCVRDHSAMTRFENRITYLENTNYWLNIAFYFQIILIAFSSTIGYLLIKNNRRH
jgi:hypothetical protein